MSKKGKDNLISLADRSTEEQREIARAGGKASGKARREKADLRKMMAVALDEKIPGKDMTHAQRLIASALNIAENPKNGAAAIRAFETILRMIGQGEPEQRQDALDILRAILAANRDNARIQAQQEAE